MKLLDLFCGGGGAAKGYADAGFEVVGVDINPQPSYPYQFFQGDALEFPLDGFDVIHASPPCQAYSSALRHRGKGKDHPKLIAAVLDRLDRSGIPFVIENVRGAGLPSSTDLFGEHGLMLCGSMFGKRFWRHRYFRTSVPILAPRECDHREWPINPYNTKSRHRDGLQFGSMKRYGQEMGVDWFVKKSDITLVVPPCYTAFIGRELMTRISQNERLA